MTRQGVLVYDGKEWHSFSAGLPDVHFSEARLTYADREGNIWVGLWGGGLSFLRSGQCPVVHRSRRPARPRSPPAQRRLPRSDLDRHNGRPSVS